MCFNIAMGTKPKKSFSMALPAFPIFLSVVFFTFFTFFTFFDPGACLAGQSENMGASPYVLSSQKPLLPCSFGFTGPAVPQLHRANPGAGEFLVATRQLTDSVFSETVILLIEYGKDGAMGLIINRPTKVLVSKLFPEVKELKKRSDRAYIGGPVEMYKVFLLLNSSKNPPGRSLHIFDGVYISPDMRTLRKMASEQNSKFRIYAGYAGWTSGQLEAEISRGDWYILAADEKAIFDMPAQEVWPSLIDRAGIEALGPAVASPALAEKEKVKGKTDRIENYSGAVPLTLVHVSVLPKSGRRI